MCGQLKLYHIHITCSVAPDLHCTAEEALQDVLADVEARHDGGIRWGDCKVSMESDPETGSYVNRKTVGGRDGNRMGQLGFVP